MKITCISDLHGHYPELPGGDLLIVAGDLTARHSKQEFSQFADWYLAQDYKKRVLIAGNHDTAIENGEYYFNHGWLGYLQDSGTEFGGFKIWGSPWTKGFKGMNPKCKAFTCGQENGLAEKWKLIPSDTDILVTHSPPWKVLDNNYGSRVLLGFLQYSFRPKLHVFGHIHEGYGVVEDFEYQYEDRNYIISSTKFINASHVNERYEPINAPISITI